MIRKICHICRHEFLAPPSRILGVVDAHYADAHGIGDR